MLDFVFMARCTYYISQDICYKGKIADISKAIILLSSVDSGVRTWCRGLCTKVVHGGSHFCSCLKTPVQLDCCFFLCALLFKKSVSKFPVQDLIFTRESDSVLNIITQKYNLFRNS